MLIFLCPAVLDSIVFLVLFAVSYGAGEHGLSLGQCAWLGGIFQLSYMVTSPLVGAALSRRNARPLLLGSVVTAMGLAAISLLNHQFWPIFGALALFGIAIAFFFNAFQTFMRGEAPPGGLARVTGLYTIAWSCGSSAGFLLAGSLYRLGATALTSLTAGISLLVFLLLYFHKARPHDALSADEHVDAAPAGTTGLHERFVWVAWIMIFTAMFVQRPIQTFYPALLARLNVAPALVSLPLFLQMLIQGVCGYGMIRFPSLRYRRGPLLVVQLAAALLLLLLWVVPAASVSAIGISLLGTWAGFAYFYAVYYASNSGHRSRNIGVNECLVGLGSFGGLMASEWVMRRLHSDAWLYAVCGTTLLVSAIAQWLVAGSAARKAAPAPLPACQP